MVVVDDNSMTATAARLGALLAERRLTLATAESCTGGWIGKVCTDVAGSSVWYQGGVVSYSNAAKQSLLGVTDASLQTEGAVSEPVVREMAVGAADALRSDCAISVSGVAGPGGGTADKPVGLVWMGAAVRTSGTGGDPYSVVAQACQFPGDRDSVRRAAVVAALELAERLITQPRS